MFAQFGMQISGFDMADLGNPEDWKLFHYEIHRAINGALGLPEPADLLDMDLKNEQNFNDFMLDHQYLHDFTDKILNLK